MINKTAEASFIQAASNNQTVATVPVASAPAPPPPASSALAAKPPFGWMGMNIQMQLLSETMKEWVLLHTGSTVHVFANPQLVTNIRKTNETLQVTTNAGTFEWKHKANLPWSDMEVWFDPNSITNVLSFGLLQEKYKIKYDNSVSDIFYVETNKGVIPFKRLTNQLYGGM